MVSLLEFRVFIIISRYMLEKHKVQYQVSVWPVLFLRHGLESPLVSTHLLSIACRLSIWVWIYIISSFISTDTWKAFSSVSRSSFMAASYTGSVPSYWSHWNFIISMKIISKWSHTHKSQRWNLQDNMERGQCYNNL